MLEQRQEQVIKLNTNIFRRAKHGSTVLKRVSETSSTASYKQDEVFKAVPLVGHDFGRKIKKYGKKIKNNVDFEQ